MSKKRKRRIKWKKKEKIIPVGLINELEIIHQKALHID